MTTEEIEKIVISLLRKVEELNEVTNQLKKEIKNIKCLP
jgi:hypothetical protein